ncbi:MAG: BatA domain-containing protein [Gemmataceae bacterium]
MFDLFLNPWAMAAGTLLISSPIIIHLINRMRYRRVRWAAMEFLLRSQKRNRRRIIIEQIILLLLRILLVLLFGFLLARFLGALAGPQQNTVHVVLLDDTPSMADGHREEGQAFDAFKQAKKAIGEIAEMASQATTPQGLVLIRLSDLAEQRQPYKIERLNSSTVAELQTKLADYEVSNLHVDLQRGLEEAQAVFENFPQERRLLHVVSDFRAVDWSGTKADAARQALDHIKKTKVDVHLIDTAFPVRSDSQRTALYHDNLAVVDFTPETRIVARYMPVEFQVGVANYSSAERKNVRVTVRVRGAERQDGSFTLPSVPANTVTTGNFLLTFDQLGANPISVNLENEEAGLAIDNVRFAAVEVRERVPLLLVEGDPKTRGTPEGDGYYLNSLFSESTRGFNVLVKAPNDIEKLDLDQFPTIFLLNVPRLSDPAVARLEKYVRGGGGVAFFLGGEVKPDFYNALYKKGEGLFPAPIADKPTEPPTDPGARLIAMFSNPLPKIYPRNEAHPVFNRIYRDEKTKTLSRENSKYLIFANVDRYFPVPRRNWVQKPGVTDELMTLPNNRTINDYADQMNKILGELPVNDERFAKYKDALERHRKAIQSALLQGGELYKLAQPLDLMLNDTGDPKDPLKPNLQEFWQQNDGQIADLRERARSLLDAVRYGDPFLVGRTFGKGRVLACTSTAGSAWNDLPNGPARVYYVMLLVEMQKYLASATADAGLTLGTPLTLELDPTRYDAKARLFTPPKFDFAKGVPVKTASNDAGALNGEIGKEKVVFSYGSAREPGVYEVVLNRKDAPPEEPKSPKAEKADPEKARQETLAYAFNIDALAESDLKRASRDDLDSVAPGASLHKPGDDSLAAALKQKKTDLSESVWLFLLFMLVLAVEQAMAVRLSFHTRDPAPAR